MPDKNSLFGQKLATRQRQISLLLTTGNLPKAIIAQRELVAFCLHNKQYQEALAALHQLIGLNPGDSEAYALIKNLLETYKL